MDEIEIDVVELEPLETGLEGGLDAFRTMIVIPDFRGDKHFLSLDLPRLEYLLDRFADLLFISVPFRGVELAKSCLQRRLGRDSGRDGVGNQRAKAERGDGTGSIIEGYLRVAKVVRFCGIRRRLLLRQAAGWHVTDLSESGHENSFLWLRKC